MSDSIPTADSSFKFSNFIDKSDLEGLPDISVIKLINLIYEVSTGKKEPKEAAKEFGAPYAVFAKVFVVKKAKQLINEGLKKADMEELSETDFADKLIACMTGVATHVQMYMKHEITDEEFIERLGNEGIQDITKKVLEASGMDREIAANIGVKDLSEIGNMAPMIVAFAAYIAAYKIIRKAQDELQLAEAERVKIEAACNESIAMIRQYRTEMEYVVNHYLTERIEVFESGFAAMDKAILENDTDGYIGGNAAIQEVLGYKSQFKNQSEFDALMESDQDFKL